MKLIEKLDALFLEALCQSGCPTKCAAMVRPSSRPEFGDYQVNGIMAAAKTMGISPHTLAKQVIEVIQKKNIEYVQEMKIAGPGFINVVLNTLWIQETVERYIHTLSNGIEKTGHPQRIVIDYSHPNIAKEMAVHHIRSTVIGDALARLYTFLGHHVIRQNHIGDWGTQFGMLIAYLEKLENIQLNEQTTFMLEDLEQFYKNAKKCFDDDESFAKKSRSYVVKLQSKDVWCTEMWKKLVAISMKQNQQLYDRLKITLTPENTMGESAYNDDLPDIVNDLTKRGLLKEDHGAKVIFLDDFSNKAGEAMGVIIQKSDGGYLYSTTDLAALRYRVNQLHADRIIYCVDARQSQHLQQIFTIARKAHYVVDDTVLDHYAFGMMLGKDGKPFKTRSGETIKLSELIDEAELRVAKLLTQKKSTLSKKQQEKIIKILAIAAIKYADLSKNRMSNYIFDWDLMLSFDGNTAPYLLYAYTRINSIFQKMEKTTEDLGGPVLLQSIIERRLAMKLVQFNDVLHQVASEGLPHYLCNYLYDLASIFMSFYEECPIYKDSVSEEIKNSRLQLCLLTSRILKQGLNILGIETVDQM